MQDPRFQVLRGKGDLQIFHVAVIESWAERQQTVPAPEN